ncbi:MAG TPA: hypothetical protein VK272_07595 [Solirubrobacteraceae bacterium]|nr:hypothetical protein [Solirubrobacteraceae bacterium]
MPAALSACAVLVASAHAETYATITPLLYPDRLGARGALSLTIQFADPGAGVPAPVRRSILRFPAGMTLEVPHLRSCSASRLRARGATGCPAESALGRGHALVEAHVGSQTLTENVSLWVFLGPLQNLQPSIEILAQGYTPFDERVVLDGTMLPTGGPYGEALTLSIPPIPTLTFEPDASIVTFSLVIGAHEQRKARDANTVRLPASCPRGGFPFAAEFSYADGSSGSSVNTAPCP